MRYIPRLRSPVSGSLVTTQGRVMKRPPSSGQHFWIGRFNNVGQASRLPSSAFDGGLETEAAGAAFAFSKSDSIWPGEVSNRWMISLHGPLLTSLGLAWRKSSAVASSFRASRKPAGGLLFR